MVGELCRGDTNFHRAAFPELLAHYAADVQELRAKEREIADLRSLPLHEYSAESPGTEIKAVEEARGD